MKKRIYLLDGKEIKSSECSGFLHKAKIARGNCMACSKPVEIDQEYVLLNYYGCPDPLHLKCFISDDPKHAIIGIGTRKGKRFGITRTYVICKDYSRRKAE